MHREALHAQIAVLDKMMDIKFPYMDYCIDWLLARKSLLARADRRHRTAVVVAAAARAAASNDAKGFYSGLRALQP